MARGPSLLRAPGGQEKAGSVRLQRIWPVRPPHRGLLARCPDAGLGGRGGPHGPWDVRSMGRRRFRARCDRLCSPPPGAGVAVDPVVHVCTGFGYSTVAGDAGSIGTSREGLAPLHGDIRAHHVRVVRRRAGATGCRLSAAEHHTAGCAGSLARLAGIRCCRFPAGSEVPNAGAALTANPLVECGHRHGSCLADT